MADFLTRSKTHFLLWRPRHTAPVPALKIGEFRAGSPPVWLNHGTFPLAPSAQFPDLWELDARTIGLIDGRVYHYFFVLRDSFPAFQHDLVMELTDPFATAVDWRMPAAALPLPYSNEDRDPAAVVLFRNDQLSPCDPGGGQADFTGDAPMRTRPTNSQMVIYELPTRWMASSPGRPAELAAGTFRDVLALVNPAATGANLDGFWALREGYAHLLTLGINALELLPPADSFMGREWGYGTSNYLAADFDLGFPEGNASPTATADLATLVRTCHQAGIRFIADVVMAFATNGSPRNVNFPDFHVQWNSGDPEQGKRDGFGGDLMKYNYRVDGYDPIAGDRRAIVPSRQWMKTFLTHWMEFYRLDGVRMDSVVNFGNWDFIREFRDLARELWRKRWAAENGSNAGAEERFLVVGEELAVPLDLIRQNRVDALWNEDFKKQIRSAVLGGPGMSNGEFAQMVRRMVDCRLHGFRDGTEAVNYITSHDVGGFQNERLFNFLANNGVGRKQERIQLAFACLLTAVGVPMILAGEEFADQHDIEVGDQTKQIDPVNFRRLEEPWRRDVFAYVARLVHFRTAAEALQVNDTRFLHEDFTPGRRIVAWERGRPGSNDRVVVVANFSGFGTPNASFVNAEYRVNNFPALPPQRKWREITQERDVPAEWAGREPIFPWEAKVYAMVAV